MVVRVVALRLGWRRPGADGERPDRDKDPGHQSAADIACLAGSGHVTLLLFPLLTSIIYTEPVRFVPNRRLRRSGLTIARDAGTQPWVSIVSCERELCCRCATPQAPQHKKPGVSICLSVMILPGTRYAVVDDCTKEPADTKDGKDGKDESQLGQPADRSPGYTARIALEQAAMDTENGSMSLEPGMTVTAEIKTGQRRVISYLHRSSAIGRRA